MLIVSIFLKCHSTEHAFMLQNLYGLSLDRVTLLLGKTISLKEI